MGRSEGRRQLHQARGQIYNRTRVFSDPLAWFAFDRVKSGEERWRVTGSVDSRQILIVIHTGRQQNGTEIIRIISARPAERWEREEYEEQNG